MQVTMCVCGGGSPYSLLAGVHTKTYTMEISSEASKMYKYNYHISCANFISC